MSRAYYDNYFDREIIELEKNGKKIKVPKVLNNRYEMDSILSMSGGTSVIFIARDKELHNKKVLIKCGKYEPNLFISKNNKKRAENIESIRKTIHNEYGAYMHAIFRGIDGIPRVIDYIEDINPNLYGPFEDSRTKESFTIEDKDIIYKEKYIVLTFIDGQIITEPIKAKINNPAVFTKKMIKAVGYIFNKLYQIREKNGKFWRFIYCDLKPDNILSTSNNDFVLIDLGSVTFIYSDKKGGAEKYTKIITTPGYRAPELDKVNKKNCKEILTPKIDIYSLGITAYILLTGEKGLKENEKRSGIDLELLRRYGQNWYNLIKGMTEPDFKDRIATISEITDKLKEC